jgi:hypothetical protein
MTAELLHVPAVAQTVGALIDLADDAPIDLVLLLLHEFAGKVSGATDAVALRRSAALRRDLVVLGALANRAIFEVCAVPKNRNHVIA